MAKRENGRNENARESTYRGRRIEVVRAPADARAAGTAAPTTLHIDGQAIEVEETPDGVMSHQNMFRVYSSPFELAEDLIKQWGDRDIQPAAGHGHDPEPDHDHSPGHGHDHSSPDGSGNDARSSHQPSKGKPARRS